MAGISYTTMTDSYRKVVEATALYLEQEFFNASLEVIDVYGLYEIFWTKLAGTEFLRQQERGRLDQALDKTQANAQERQHSFNIHARAFQDCLVGQDEAARERLQGLEVLHVPFILNQLRVLYENKAWRRLHQWLRWFLPYMESQDLSRSRNVHLALE